jgi:hypothetical protein
MKIDPSLRGSLPRLVPQHRPEQTAAALPATPAELLRKLHECLRRLVDDGAADPSSFSCPKRWAELEDAVGCLIPVKRRLPGRLFWQFYLPLKDSRRRLEANSADRHAVNQLKYVEKVLTRAVNGLENTDSGPAQ